MKAQTLVEIKSPLEFQTRDALQPENGEVIVHLSAAALNRRDFWITRGMYPGIKPPVVVGSDGTGVVTSIGEGVDDDWLQKEVIINPGLDWGDDDAVQAKPFHILGLPTDGTFATEVRVPVTNLFQRPPHLSWQQAAAIPLAGVTAYRALFSQGNLQPDEKVLITGIGGGVATFALQFAVAAGVEVWTTSSSNEKLDKANQHGAKGGFLYTDPNWLTAAKESAGGFDLVIDSAGGKGYADLVELALPGGRIVNYGATTGPPEKLDLFKVFWKQLTLRGSTMGSPGDFADMLAFVNEKQIQPIIDRVFGFAEINEAMELMATSPQFGKYVIEIGEGAFND